MAAAFYGYEGFIFMAFLAFYFLFIPLFQCIRIFYSTSSPSKFLFSRVPPPQEQIHNPPYSGLYFSKSPLTFIPLRYKLKKKKYLYFCWKKKRFSRILFFCPRENKKNFYTHDFFCLKMLVFMFLSSSNNFFVMPAENGWPTVGAGLVGPAAGKDGYRMGRG